MDRWLVTCQLPGAKLAAWRLPFTAKNKREAIRIAKRGCTIKDEANFTAELSTSVCIEDFCGYSSPGHFATTFSADWFPAESLTFFSGEWHDCPPMSSPTQPTEADVWAWARKHSAYFATASTHQN